MNAIDNKLWSRTFNKDDSALTRASSGELAFISVCKHCCFPKEDHVDGKCVFDAQSYELDLVPSNDGRVLFYRATDGDVYISFYAQPLIQWSFAQTSGLGMVNTNAVQRLVIGSK